MGIYSYLVSLKFHRGGGRYFIILAVEILHLLKLFEPSQCNTVLSTNNLFYYQFYMYINLHFMPSIMFNITCLFFTNCFFFFLWSAIFVFFVLLFIFDNLLFICYFCCLPIFVTFYGSSIYVFIY